VVLVAVEPLVELGRDVVGELVPTVLEVGLQLVEARLDAIASGARVLAGVGLQLVVLGEQLVLARLDSILQLVRLQRHAPDDVHARYQPAARLLSRRSALGRARGRHTGRGRARGVRAELRGPARAALASSVQFAACMAQHPSYDDIVRRTVIDPDSSR